MRQQVLDACDRNRSAADLMNLLLWIHEDRKRLYPDDDPGSPRLLIELSVSRFELLTGLSRRSVQRGLKLLLARGFIQVNHSTGYKNQYAVVEGRVEKYLQPMQLFEIDELKVRVDTGVKLTPGGVSGWHPSPPLNDTPLSLLANIATHQQQQADDEPIQAEEEKDEERDELINRFRLEADTSKEVTEHYLTLYTRQLMFCSLEWLGREKRRTKVDSPGGAVNRFLKNPEQKGYERGPDGIYRRAAAYAERKPPKPAEPLPSLPAPKQEHWIAWESCSGQERDEIRSIVNAQHASVSAGIREHYCAKEALRRRQGVLT